MFNLQGSELIIILLLALVVLGPEKLPDAMRKLGQLYAEIRKMSSGFQQEFRSVMDEPMQEMRDTANLLRDSADFTKLQDGERDEKPKTAEMPTDGDPEPAPTDDVPFRDTDDDGAAAPVVAAADAAAGASPPETDAEPDPPPPFGRNPTSLPPPAAPEPVDVADPTDAEESVDVVTGGNAGGVDTEPSRPRPFGPGQLSSTAPRAEPPTVSPAVQVTDASDASGSHAATGGAEMVESRPRPFGPGQVSSAAPRWDPPTAPDQGDAPRADGQAAANVDGGFRRSTGS